MYKREKKVCEYERGSVCLCVLECVKHRKSWKMCERESMYKYAKKYANV